MPTFTIFTATYNRAAKLNRPFSSLKAQTYKDFEWLIVDDGSQDETGNLVEEWVSSSHFPIRYVFQKHLGLHMAFNRAIQEASGKFFLPLDSDDALESRALERLFFHWNNIPGAQRPSFSGVCCLCRDEKGYIIGDKFPKDVMDSDSLEIWYKYRTKGQKGGFHRLEVIKEFPFDETPEMGCNPWRRIARKYKMRFVNEALEIYCQGSPEDSLARWPKRIRPITGLYRNLEILNREIDYYRFWPAEFYRSATRYARYSFHCRWTISNQRKHLESAIARKLWSLSWPLGYLIYLRDRLIGLENVQPHDL